MTDNEYLISLLRGILKGQPPQELPEGCSFKRVFSLAQKHSVSRMAFYAAEALRNPPQGELSAAWRQVRDKALVKDLTQQAENKMERSGRKAYVFRLIFPTFEHMKRQYPVLKKAPVLLPFCWLLRLVTKPFINRKANAQKLKMLIRK